MRRFHFRLEVLLKYRKLQTDQAQAALGQATLDWQKQVARLQTLQLDKRQAEDYFRKLQQTAAVKVDDFISFHTYKEMLNQRIDQQTELVHAAEQYREECRLRLVEASKRQKLVEKIKEKRWQQFNVELLRQEQKELDEIGLQLHARGELQDVEQC